MSLQSIVDEMHAPSSATQKASTEPAAKVYIGDPFWTGFKMGWGFIYAQFLLTVLVGLIWFLVVAVRGLG